ncbi:Asp-tRNA(Asn)/Glu-tRNA(Gln) amidotransferase GatCAB subunit C, partial [bacterium]|nr:Asp-tRNA(Asn)/Glu-tRNA(Gln) amidotransferase GatCAB subunit C [bacterium]
MSAPQINISDVASLARLTLTPEETAKFSSQLGQILS